MKNTLKTWIADALSLWIIDLLFAGIQFHDAAAVILTALVLALLNATIKPLLQVIALPFTILTFGLFSLLINAAVLVLAFRLVPGSYLNSFWTAVWASIILSFVNSGMRNLLGE